MPSLRSASTEKGRLAEHYNGLAAVNHQDDDAIGGPVRSESLIGVESDTDDETTTRGGPSSSSGPADHAPPIYSGPASPAHEAALERQDGSAAAAAVVAAKKRPFPRYPGLPYVDYRVYSPPLFDLSLDKTVLKSSAPYLSATASALANLIRTQATVPPKPLIHIQGTRGSKVDFSVKANLMHLLLSEDPRRRMNYVRCVGRGELALRGGNANKPSAQPDIESSDAGSAIDAWCRRFVEDQSSVKSFVFERQVANMDIGWLEGQIRSLVATTGYKGVVTVTFPVTHARVIVQNPDKVNKFFTSVATLFTGKSTYEVVKAVWPFATHKAGDPARKFAVQSEEMWWKEWRDPIRYAISTKRTGWVTNEDKLEALMEGVGRNITTVEWGSEYS
ncbi:hypothetical protein SPBR_03780 [Sporothrix brasiliensis 5110]|uniref:Uncharacterized protein n=1 Tax=Sporothrix brasiliensis 5110 TaxID=1398154 RepID=A0A0C2JCY0_9PEZI|nr:uncharacterized protein SPBR_03780 [Sporothrix brasiliensis 5110]KIH94777.1 hypothetical protein SPBR_03780 [Sporothrix brasiliensis 5110]